MAFQFCLRFFVLTSLAFVAGSNPDYSQCKNDDDCAKGSFCNTKIGNKYCELCVGCRRDYFRHPSDRTDCSKSSHECGNCLSGYYEEILSLFRKRARCMPIKEDKKGRVLLDSDFIYLLVIFGVIRTAAAAFAVAVMFFIWCWKMRSGMPASEIDDAEAPTLDDPLQLPLPPPPYRERAPHNIPGGGGADFVWVSPHFLSRSRRGPTSLSINVEESKCNATPFNYSRYQQHLSGGSSNLELEEVISDRSPSPTGSANSNVTEPSQWRPGEQTSGLDEPDLANFEEEAVDEQDVIEDVAERIETEPNHDEDGQLLPFIFQDDYFFYPGQSPDSGFLTTMMSDDRNFGSVATLGDSPEPFPLTGSETDLSELNQVTAGTPDGGGSPIPIENSLLPKLAFNEVGMSSRESQETKEQGDDGDGRIHDLSRKRRGLPESADEQSVCRKLRFML